MGSPLNLVGQRYGRLVVLRRNGTDGAGTDHPSSLWECQCDCGKICTKKGCLLTLARTTSCGCLSREMFAKMKAERKMKFPHAKMLYRLWGGIKGRCYRETDGSYHNYGGRGITMHPDWIPNANKFCEWATASGFKPGLTIDRIDNDGNYCPDNCRWVTYKHQSVNKRSNVLITYKGETLTQSQWCEKIGMKPMTFAYRRRAGWTLDEIFNQSVSQSNPRKKLAIPGNVRF